VYLRDFQCECGHVQEEMFDSYGHFLDEQTKRKCLNCGEPTLPMLCGGNFALKGGGWAKDGYGS
jgi:hypothetical protein